MKKIGYCFLILLGIILIISCGKKDETASQKPIKIMLPFLGTSAPSADNDIHRKLEELTEESFEVQWVIDSMYHDRVSITLVSDEVPHVMRLDNREAATGTLIESGAFWELDEYLPEYPYLSQANPGIQANASFNGKTYGIYRARDLIRSAVIIRNDWLTNLGLSEPQTIEEFEHVLDQFTNNDPDGNGIDDTYGMIITQYPGPFEQIAAWFGVPNGAQVEDGKVTMDFMTEAYAESLEFFKRIYEKGYINADFVTMEPNRWNEPFLNGKAGVIVDVQSRAMALSRRMNEKYGDDGEHGDTYVTMVGNVTVDHVDALYPTDGFQSILAIPKQSVKTEEELHRVLAFLDKLNSEEATLVANIGIEGVNYWFDEDGKFTKPDDDSDLMNTWQSYPQISMNVPGWVLPKVSYGSKLEDRRVDIQTKGLEQAVFNPIASYRTEVYNKKGAQLQNIIDDARIQYIAGQIDAEGLQAAIDLWLRSGGSDHIAQLEELVNENE